MRSAQPISLGRQGLHFYETHFGYKYVDVNEQQAETEWLLLPNDRYDVGPIPLEGKTVAIVGNGVVRGVGDLIDANDAVIRVNYPYSWAVDPQNDGKKITHWAGLGKNEVFRPHLFCNPEKHFSLLDMSDHLLRAESFHCISHHHVQAGFWSDIQNQNLDKRTSVLLSTPFVFDLIERSPFGRDQRLLSWLTTRTYLENGYGGWFGWDCLLTGIRVVLLTALSRPASIGIFGMNFYQDQNRTPWDVHDISLNKEVLDKIVHICCSSNIPIKIFENE